MIFIEKQTNYIPLRDDWPLRFMADVIMSDSRSHDQVPSPRIDRENFENFSFLGNYKQLKNTNMGSNFSGFLVQQMVTDIFVQDCFKMSSLFPFYLEPSPAK